MWGRGEFFGTISERTQGKVSRKAEVIVRVGVSLFILLLLLYYIRVGKVLQLLLSVRLKWFLILLVLITVDRVFMAYKWSLLLRVKCVKYTIAEVIELYYVGTFVGIFLPTTVGGDVIRGYGLVRGGRKAKDVFSSIVVERVLGFFASLVVAVVSMVLFIYMFKPRSLNFVYIVVGIFIVFMVVVVLSFNSEILAKITKFFPKRIFQWKIAGKLKEVYFSYLEYKKHGTILVKFFLLSLVEQMAPILGNYISARAFGVSVPFVVFLSIIPLIQLVNRIPISFNGIGLNEGLLVYFFSSLGLSSTLAFSIGLLGHIGIVLATIPGLCFYVLGGTNRKKTTLLHGGR